jgi:hypothetical protein
LLLHEAAHQFHHFAATGHTSPASWYGEGVAEHLSHHTWDGTTLRTGVVPMLSLETRAKFALAAAESDDYQLDRMFAADSDVSRPECMHVVRYLLAGDDGKYAKKFKALARDTVPGQFLRSSKTRWARSVSSRRSEELTWHRSLNPSPRRHPTPP